jgi:hypothetical protein
MKHSETLFIYLFIYLGFPPLICTLFLVPHVLHTKGKLQTKNIQPK